MGLTRADVEFDHSPPLALRVWDQIAGDTIPPANDPAHIVMRIKAAHREKTIGSPTRASNRGADVTEIARTRKAAGAQRAFVARLLAKDAGEPRPQPKWGRRQSWGKGR